jgi:hypothetical protein
VIGGPSSTIKTSAGYLRAAPREFRARIRLIGFFKAPKRPSAGRQSGNGNFGDAGPAATEANSRRVGAVAETGPRLVGIAPPSALCVYLPDDHPGSGVRGGGGGGGGGR